jgi:hypothetical protein
MKREQKAPRFNVYANLGDGRGTIRFTEKSVHVGRVATQVKAAISAGATKEPLVIRA